MDLIIGGAYQGKCTFAAEKYRLTAADICDLAADAPAPARCYVHLEALTRRGQAAEALPLLLAAEVVVAREIGSGVVPIDAGERAWRERHGRLLRQLAESAGHVYRVFCGLTEEFLPSVSLHTGYGKCRKLSNFSVFCPIAAENCAANRCRGPPPSI